MNRGSVIFGCLLSVLAGMGLMRGLHSGHAGHDNTTVVSTNESQPASASDAQASVPVSPADPSWGSATAPVTIVEFSSFRCGHCSKVRSTLAGLKSKYGPEQLRIVWKNSAPPAAKPAHIAAMAVFELAGSEAFWKFHDLAFESMRDQTPESFAKWAEQVGVDRAKFEQAFKGGSAAAKVDKDIQLSRQLGVRGTPGFFINGVTVRGAQPQAKFEEEIDRQLQTAKKLIASGAAKDQLYTILTNQNKAKAAPAEKAGEGADKDDNTVWKVTVSDSDPYKGSAEALVTVVEFSEFQCPFCKRVLPTMKQIEESYGDKVRIVWKDNPLPFHKRALPASTLAREALAQKGQSGFWKAHDLLFDNQRKLEDDDLLGYAATLQLDVEKAKAAIANNAHKGVINAAQSLAADVNATGTPHFFVNGRRVVGAQPFEKFKSIIDEEIKKSEALLAKGIAKKDLYAEIIKNGKEPPPPEEKAADDPPANAPKKGAADYLVTIYEYSDFQCPFCARVNDTLTQVMAAYGDRVRVVWRHKPLAFHKDAPLAHQAAQEAYAQKGDAGFWDFHDKLFAGQKKPGLKREALEQYASELGLDMTKFKAALDKGTHLGFIEQENKASEALAIRGTPGFMVVPKGAKKGYFISGAQSFGKFQRILDRALTDAGGAAGANDNAATEAAAVAEAPSQPAAPTPPPARAQPTPPRRPATAMPGAPRPAVAPNVPAPAKAAPASKPAAAPKAPPPAAPKPAVDPYE